MGVVVKPVRARQVPRRFGGWQAVDRSKVGVDVERTLCYPQATMNTPTHMLPAGYDYDNCGFRGSMQHVDHRSSVPKT